MIRCKMLWIKNALKRVLRTFVKLQITKLANNVRNTSSIRACMKHRRDWRSNDLIAVRTTPFPTAVPSILFRSLSLFSWSTERTTRDELSISGSDVSASRIRSRTNGYRLTQIDKRQGYAFGSRGYVSRGKRFVYM